MPPPQQHLMNKRIAQIGGLALVWFLLMQHPALSESYPQTSSTTWNNKTTSSLPAGSVLKKKGILLMFMNPNGRPCQIQKAILEKSRGDIEQQYKIRFVNAANPSDRPLFYQFGVRGMPAIILLNSSGRIHHRFPPGIMDRNQLLQTINQPR